MFARTVFLSFLLLCATLVQAQQAQRTVSVSGHGEVQAAPDRADVSLSVEQRNRDLAAARRQVSESSNRLLKLTDELGIERKRIQSSGLNLRPEYRWNKSSEQQELIGYVVTRQFSIDLRDLEKLGPLLERAVTAGATHVSPPQLGSSREAEYRREALRRAGQNARLNAVAVATSLSARIGAAREITAQQGYRPPRPPVAMRMAAMADSAGAAESSYETGLLSFSADVNVSFDLITE